MDEHQRKFTKAVQTIEKEYFQFQWDKVIIKMKNKEWQKHSRKCALSDNETNYMNAIMVLYKAKVIKLNFAPRRIAIAWLSKKQTDRFEQFYAEIKNVNVFLAFRYKGIHITPKIVRQYFHPFENHPWVQEHLEKLEDDYLTLDDTAFFEDVQCLSKRDQSSASAGYNATKVNSSTDRHTLSSSNGPQRCPDTELEDNREKESKSLPLSGSNERRPSGYVDKASNESEPTTSTERSLPTGNQMVPPKAGANQTNGSESISSISHKVSSNYMGQTFRYAAPKPNSYSANVSNIPEGNHLGLKVPNGRNSERNDARLTSEEHSMASAQIVCKTHLPHKEQSLAKDTIDYREQPSSVYRQLPPDINQIKQRASVPDQDYSKAHNAKEWNSSAEGHIQSKPHGLKQSSSENDEVNEAFIPKQNSSMPFSNRSGSNNTTLAKGPYNHLSGQNDQNSPSVNRELPISKGLESSTNQPFVQSTKENEKISSNSAAPFQFRSNHNEKVSASASEIKHSKAVALGENNQTTIRLGDYDERRFESKGIPSGHVSSAPNSSQYWKSSPKPLAAMPNRYFGQKGPNASSNNNNQASSKPIRSNEWNTSAYNPGVHPSRTDDNSYNQHMQYQYVALPDPNIPSYMMAGHSTFVENPWEWSYVADE